MQLFDPKKAIEESYVFFSCVLVKFLKNGRDQMTVQGDMDQIGRKVFDTMLHLA